MRFIALISDPENWWFELEASSMGEAKKEVESKLCDKRPLGRVEIVEVTSSGQDLALDRPAPATMPQDDLITLVADGSCKGNPGPGGWAALLLSDGREILRSGGEDETTNNRMELTAVMQGLFLIPRPSKIRVIVDSRYVMDAFDKGWLKNWKKNGWRTAGKEPVKNRDLWEVLEREIQKHEVQWQWVKGHSGHPLNEKVDAEANKQASYRT